MTTQKEVRAAFWEQHPQFKHEYRTRKKQNEYRTDVRVTFCDFVESLRRNNEISKTLANNVTL